MKKLLSVISIFIIQVSYGVPDKVSVYFLSPQLASSYFFQSSFGPKYAFNNTDCVQMGDHCFHPQHGIVSTKKSKEIKKQNEVPRYNTLQLDEVSRIKCNKGHHFDVFCGSESKNKEDTAKLALWIDNSSSMRRVDLEDKTGFCERRHISSMFLNKCGSSVSVNSFNTGRKEILNSSYMCTDYGTNDGRRLARWIKNSNVKHLILITDVDEYTGELREFLDQSGASIYGIGVKPLYASTLMKQLKPLLKSCL